MTTTLASTTSEPLSHAFGGPTPSEEERLMTILIGLANDEGLVRGIAARAISLAADIIQHPHLPDLATKLDERGLIAFYPGSSLFAHTYRLLTAYPPAFEQQCSAFARPRISDALRVIRKGSSDTRKRYEALRPHDASFRGFPRL